MSARTAAQREVHRRLMEKALLEGIDVDDLRSAAPEKFGLTPHQAARDLQFVLAGLAEFGQRIRRHEDDNVALAISLKRRHRLLREALDKKDFRLALEAEKDICKLLGVYPAERDDLADEMEGRDLDAAIESELAKLASKAQDADAAEAETNGSPRDRRFAVV